MRTKLHALPTATVSNCRLSQKTIIPYPRPRLRHGFSLFEILVVMALLAILGGIVTLNFDRLVIAVQEKPIDRVLFEALQDARLLAATTGNEVEFTFNGQSGEFVIKERNHQQGTAEDTDEDAFHSPAPQSGPQTFAFDRGDRTEVLFYPRLSQTSGMGTSRDEYASEAVPRLLFHPSGVATPARVVIRQPGLSELSVDLDAFSSGPFLKEE